MTTTEGIQYHEQKARPYQAILEEIASSKNTIIHLPTGSGKTFIAQRLIKKFRNQLKKPWGEGGKRSFFLVNTVPLVNQQKNVIEMMCPVDGVGAYSSEDGVDYWKKADWDSELARNQVIVMTSQILSDMLTHAYIRIEDINLIIFDECHHAVEDHPMRVIMKHFLNCKAHEQPRVLGLTATLLNGNVSISKIEETLKQLENTFHATIATVDDLGEVMTYSTNPQEFIQYFRKPQMSEAAKEAISLLNTLQNLVMSVKLPVSLPSKDFKKTPCQRDISNDPNKIVKAVKNLIVGMITNLEEMGLYGGSLGILAYIVLLERLKRKASTKEENLLYSTVITHSTEARMILLDAMENETGYDKIIKHSSEKILQLIDLLKEYNPLILEKPGELLKVNHSRKPLCGIIFTKQRFTSKILYNILMDLKKARPDEFEFLKHDFVVGFSINPFKSTREEHYLKKSSQKAILGFNNGDLNCLISTSVIEEGLDIPQCALVVRYDAPTEYRSYIQSKGRARSSEASFVILVDIEDKQSFLIKYDAFQKTEERIRNLIVGDDSRAAPTTQDIHENLYDDDEVPPYETSNGNILYSVSAISLLSRYCSILPHDQFTTITPVWLQEVVENGAKKQVTVILPIGSPVKEEIKGDPYSNTKTAKRSAALKACIKLHELGELHPLTLLPYKYAEVDYERDDIRGCFPNWTKDCETEIKENVPKPGSKKRKRKHKIQFPSHLDAVPDSSVFYLHVIKMEAAFEKPNDNREKALYDFIKRNECYGFLTQKPLPKLCEFPAFTSVGEITTSIEVNYAVIKLTPIIFELVKQFHYFLFDQILAINKKFLIFEGTKNCMYVVPVLEHNGYNIDWATMQTHHTVPPVAAPSVEERKSLVVTEENYTNCIVTPWYRGTILPERYVVTKVLEYMTPKSQFDADCYESYANYYANNYNLDILGSESQPLLEVRNISTRMNCLLPRAATLKAFTDKQLKMISIAFGDDKPKGFAEIFIPEFCIKYDYPGVLWYKATLLPSIIHRVHMLLVAHELLVEISNATKYGQPILKKTESFQPIQVDRYIAINSLLSQVEEPLHVHTIDRIHKGTDDCLKKVVPLKKSLYKLQRKKIDKEYPWDQRIEPIDVERNLSTITLMDIECYDEFVSAPISSASNNPCSPPRIVPKAPAIAPPPIKYVDKIEILKKTPTGRGPELRDVLAALTTINSNDTFDLERPETLGDSFLKFAASLYLHHKFPNMNEGQLTNIKGKLISNRNLYYAGAKFNLGGRMKVEQFSEKVPDKVFAVMELCGPVTKIHTISMAGGVAASNTTTIPNKSIPKRQPQLNEDGTICPVSTSANMDRETDNQFGIGNEPSTSNTESNKNVRENLIASIDTANTESNTMSTLTVVPTETRRRRNPLPYTFHYVHGKNIKLCSSDTVAVRTSGYKDGLAIISQPLRRGHSFRFRIDKVMMDWLGSVGIGAVGHLASEELPPTAMQLEPPVWVITSDLIYDNGDYIKTKRGAPLDNLTEQSVLTIHFRLNSDIAVDIDSEPLGVIGAVSRNACHVFPLIDLYGRVTQVSVLLHPHVVVSGTSIDLPIIAENQREESMSDLDMNEEPTRELFETNLTEMRIRRKLKAYSHDNLIEDELEPIAAQPGPSSRRDILPLECIPLSNFETKNPAIRRKRQCPNQLSLHQSLIMSDNTMSSNSCDTSTSSRFIHKSHSSHNFSLIQDDIELKVLRHTYSVGSQIADHSDSLSHGQFYDTNIRHNDRYPEANDVDNLDNEIMDALTLETGNLPDLTEEQSSSLDESTRRDELWSEQLSIENLNYLNRILCFDQEMDEGQSLESEWEASGEGCEHLHLVLKYWNFLVCPYPELRKAVSWGQVRCYCSNCQPDLLPPFAGWVRIERIDGVGAAQRGFWNVSRNILGSAQAAHGESGSVRRPRALVDVPCTSTSFSDIWIDEEGKPHQTVLAIEIDIEGSEAANDRLLSFLIYLKPHSYSEENPPSLDD